ncbi:MAG: 4Fe-4S dicluster domain-containing protein [Methanobacteriaceae archaeon]|nr:4Fe-4S dicluster domain-containing protein [Methanobacteriaceae archaeon]
MKEVKKYSIDDLEDNKLLCDEILDDIKASPDLGLLRCVQCGMCASTCPAARNSEYDPRVMIKRVLDNDQTILTDDFIWNCFYCYNCHSICPVGNSACEINQILRQKAIETKEGKEKIVSFISFADSYISTGLGVIPKEYCETLSDDYGNQWDDLCHNLDEIRDDLDLESRFLLPEATNEISKVLNAIGFTKRVDNIKKLKDEK